MRFLVINRFIRDENGLRCVMVGGYIMAIDIGLASFASAVPKWLRPNTHNLFPYPLPASTVAWFAIMAIANNLTF